MRAKETDERRIAQRRKQIELGKSTRGYHTYTALVPRPKRHPNLAFSKHPITPNPLEKCSKRRFDGKLRVWRRGIHSFEEEYQSGNLTAVVGASEAGAPTAGPKSAPSNQQATLGSRLQLPLSATTGGIPNGNVNANNLSVNPSLRAPKPCYLEHGMVQHQLQVTDAATKQALDAFIAAQLKGEPIQSVIAASRLVPVDDDENTRNRSSYMSALKRKTAHKSNKENRNPANTGLESIPPIRFGRTTANQQNQQNQRNQQNKGRYTNPNNRSREQRERERESRNTWRNERFQPQPRSNQNQNNNAAGGSRNAYGQQSTANTSFGSTGSGRAGGGANNRSSGRPNNQRDNQYENQNRQDQNQRQNPNRAPNHRQNQANAGSAYSTGAGALPTQKEFTASREALGDISNNPRDVFPIPERPRRAYKETQIPSPRKTAPERRPASSYLVLPDGATAAASAAQTQQDFGAAATALVTESVYGPPPGLYRSKGISAPKCARYNEGACEQPAARCEYRHAVWTLSERVEHEARRAFADNSRLLEQNSVLLNRLREQDAVILEQGSEISTLLEEIHRLRMSSVPRYRSSARATAPAGFTYSSDLDAATAANIAATAIRRSPMRASSSRRSFQQIENLGGNLHETSLTKQAAPMPDMPEITSGGKTTSFSFEYPAVTKHVYANIYDPETFGGNINAAAAAANKLKAQHAAAKAKPRRARTPRKETPRKELRSRQITFSSREVDDPAAAIDGGGTRIARGPHGSGFKQEEGIDKGSWLIKRLAAA